MSDVPPGPGWWKASDGQWYPPQSAPQQVAYRPPVYVQPWNNGMNGCLIAFLVVAGIGAVLTIGLIVIAAVSVDEAVDQVNEAAETPSDGLVSGDEDEVDDVVVDDCREGAFGDMVAVLEVTNNSPDPSTYFIDVVFENRAGSRQFGTGVASVTQLRNGQTTTVEASSIEQAPDGRFECRVAEVERLAS